MMTYQPIALVSSNARALHYYKTCGGQYDAPFEFDISKPVVQANVGTDGVGGTSGVGGTNGLIKESSFSDNAICNQNTFGHLLHKQSHISKRVYIPYKKQTFDSENKNFQLIMEDSDNCVSNLILSFYPRSQSKLDYMKKTVLNPFLSEDIRMDFMLAFATAQRMYYALSRFARAVKFRLSRYRNSEDMFMNPIKSTDRNVISILQHGQLYLFTITDLKRIIDTALSHSPWFFNEPLSVKNPYNNIPFQKADLYNIYFFMKSRIIHMSALFHQYFLSNFNLGHFRDENPALIQSVYIQQYVKNMDPTLAYNSILKIFRSVQYGPNKIDIDPDFPKERLLTIMRPYLLLYHLSTVSFDVIVKQTSVIRLRKAMIAFYRFNPQFGRKFISATSKTISFNDKHVHFQQPNSLNAFATSHLDVDDEDPVGNGGGGDIDEGSDSGSDDESVVIAAYEDRRPDYSMQVQIVAVEGEIGDDNSDYESDEEEENEEIYDP
jgi:hypothetical protein